MKKEIRKMKRLEISMILALLGLPASAGATCLQDCDQTASSTSTTTMTNSEIGNQYNEHRQRSHDFGDNNTAILGDVRIRIGHEKVEITGMRDSQNSVIDTSIHSTVILGNMKQ